MKIRIPRRLAAVVVAAASVVVPAVATAPAASARSCKWVLVSYDPTTDTSVWQCSTARA